MQLTLPAAEVFVPDGLPLDAALARTTHLAVAAHQDDIEIMAYHGVAECFGTSDRWFTGVVVTNGAGSPRAGAYAAYTDEQMLATRRQEQKKAAIVGEYAAVALLDYPSPAVRDAVNPAITTDLVALLQATRPRVVYTHNPADKHDAHVAVALRTVAAIRQLPAEHRPDQVLGCEVWRDLDWMADDDKVALDVSAHENLAVALLGVFDSQIGGGKRYDLAALGRRRAHATYHAPLATDSTPQMSFAMDLMPLVTGACASARELVGRHIERLRQDVEARLDRLGLDTTGGQ